MCRIDTLDKGLCLNVNGSLRIFEGFRFYDTLTNQSL